MWAYCCEAEVRVSAAQVEWMVAVAARMHALGWAEYDTLLQVKKKGGLLGPVKIPPAACKETY